jgi:glutamyl-tRNA reductase
MSNNLVDANLKERQMAAEAISNEIPAEIKAHNDWVNISYYRNYTQHIYPIIMCFNFSRNFIRNSFSRHLSM